MPSSPNTKRIQQRKRRAKQREQLTPQEKAAKAEAKAAKKEDNKTLRASKNRFRYHWKKAGIMSTPGSKKRPSIL